VGAATAGLHVLAAIAAGHIITHGYLYLKIERHWVAPYTIILFY